MSLGTAKVKHKAVSVLRHGLFPAILSREIVEQEPHDSVSSWGPSELKLKQKVLVVGVFTFGLWLVSQPFDEAIGH